MIVAVAIGFFEVIKFQDEFWNKAFAAAANLFPVFYFGRVFWYKNYVQCNRRGIMIKVKSFSSTNFSFSDLNTVELEDNKLTIKHGGKTSVLNLGHIVEKDQQKLLSLIENHGFESSTVTS
ncbi:hypothetical protein SAMN05192588_1250 [Nonlabens sp. Hel1_33_55]|uniref:hypothetical protein n=1 Tax=Nonlabens sp. Hel1_33_55 TaxID=1336802 RepID=UPI000875DB6D|nr:hypothetical protein [Nonlabens sp. Hel1_33_55]SCY12153.1 hypothetical protein SAMN05192588_1250 [Nonlabens sp. Hel1_33_55]